MNRRCKKEDKRNRDSYCRVWSDIFNNKNVNVNNETFAETIKRYYTKDMILYFLKKHPEYLGWFI